jgi:hypothetical protein
MTRALISIVTVCALFTVARAEEEEEEPPTRGNAKAAAKDDDSVASVSASSGDLVEVGAPKGRVTLPGGRMMFNVIGEANLAKGQTAKPLSIAPDLWLGVADKLTFGIYHSGRAATGFLTGYGSGICLRAKMGICAFGLGDIYTAVGSEVRIGLTEGGFASSLVLGGQVRAFEPDPVISGKAGFMVRLHGKRLGVELAPMALIGITQRKVMGVEFNRDELVAPVTIFIRLAPRFSFALQSGITFALKKPGDTYRVPAAAGFAFFLGGHLSVDVAFGLAAVADKDDMTKAFDQRSATLGLGYAM